VSDEPPIAYQLLDTGVPVVTSDGVTLGNVASVLAAEEKDIFHGLLISTGDGLRFVGADQISQLHEHSVDLRIDAEAGAALPGPEHRAPVYSELPDQQQPWRHWWHVFTGRNDWRH
jgi:hypothetical protein